MFVNRLIIALKLTIDGTNVEVPGGNIKNFRLALTTRGYQAELDFWLVSILASSEDDLYTKFVTSKLIEVSLSIDRAFNQVGEEAEPIVLAGIVRKRSVRERVYEELSGEPVMQRRYWIDFCDRAQALWGQHQPIELFVDKTTKEVINAHLPSGVTLSFDWTGADTKYAVFMLGVGAPDSRASFYDWLMWLLKGQNAELYYDYSNDSYKIVGSKQDRGTVQALPIGDVDLLDVVFPEVVRTNGYIKNGTTVLTTTSDEMANDNLHKNIRRDYLIRTDVAGEQKSRLTLEKARRVQRQEELCVVFSRYPSVTFAPSLVFDFSEGWSDNVRQRRGKYRVYDIEVIAQAESQEATDDDEEDGNSYELSYIAKFELKDDARFRYPLFEKPVWPIQVEGKVVSARGDENQETYQYNTDKDTSLDYYRVAVPLWANQEVVVKYDPNTLPGHFYFPAYKGERVLLEIEHTVATIVRFLEWRTGAKLAQESDGNHLLLGKTNATDWTSMSHYYDNASPVFKIQRNKDKDVQTITISEGNLHIEVKEESSE